MPVLHFVSHPVSPSPLITPHHPSPQQLTSLTPHPTPTPILNPNPPPPPPQSQAFLADLKRCHALFVTPTGSNDDWYWLYAAVAAGERGMLISNDLMRDHLFSLLAPKYFKASDG